MLSCTRQNRELVNVLWWTDLFQVGFLRMRLSQWSNFKLIGDIQVVSLQQCGVQNGFLWPMFFVGLRLGNFGKKRTWIWPTKPGDSKTPGSGPNNPNGSNFGLSPERHLSGGHLSAPETRQRMKRPWGAKSTSMSRPCHGTYKAFRIKGIFLEKPNDNRSPRKMNGQNAGQKKCLGGWFWIIHYKVTQKCGKAQQPTLQHPHFARETPSACQEKLVAKSMKGTGTLPVPSTSPLRGRGSASISTIQSIRQTAWSAWNGRAFFFLLTNWNSWAVYRNTPGKVTFPKGSSLPTIIFQGRTVKLQGFFSLERN